VNIVVNPQFRTAAFDSPAVLSAGELITVVLSGLSSPDVPTLKLAVFSIGTVDVAPVILALCDAFTAGTNVWNGSLDTRTLPVETLLTGARPDQRYPITFAIADQYRLWAAGALEIVNNPLRGSPVAVDPSVHYLTKETFAQILSLDADTTTVDDLVAKLNAIINLLRTI